MPELRDLAALVMSSKFMELMAALALRCTASRCLYARVVTGGAPGYGSEPPAQRRAVWSCRSHRRIATVRRSFLFWVLPRPCYHIA